MDDRATKLRRYERAVKLTFEPTDDEEYLLNGAIALYWLKELRDDAKKDEDNEEETLKLFNELTLVDIYDKTIKNLRKYLINEPYEKLTEIETKELEGEREGLLYSWRENKDYDKLGDYYTQGGIEALGLVEVILGSE